jgi:hypothetical protein
MWGNGECPKTCKLYNDSAKIAEDQASDADPDALRKIALNAVIDRSAPIGFVAAALNACQNERKS